MQRFHHSQFLDTTGLAALKNRQRISVCIPTLDEAETIGSIVSTVCEELMERVPLVDEILVIDKPDGR